MRDALLFSRMYIPSVHTATYHISDTCIPATAPPPGPRPPRAAPGGRPPAASVGWDLTLLQPPNSHIVYSSFVFCPAGLKWMTESKMGYFVFFVRKLRAEDLREAGGLAPSCLLA